MVLSLVTTAYQSGPWVKAVAVVPSGSVNVSGSAGPLSVEKRMTSRVKMARSPKIMVAVKIVTNRRRNRRFAGSAIWESL